MPDVKPKYEVEPFTGEYEVLVTRYDIEKVEGRKNPVLRRHQKKEKRTGGFMVYTPRGESIHVRDVAGLKALGINPNVSPGMVDMESGEEVAAPTLSLKKLAQQKTAKNDARSAATGSV